MTDDRFFAALSRRACPALADTLLAVAAAWRPVNWADVDAALDELALPLFCAPAAGRERAAVLSELVTETFAPDAGHVDGLWLDRVLERRRGHPVVIASIATELGRRAGWEITVCSSPTAWYAGLHDDGVLWLIEALGTGAGSPAHVRRHCAHEIAFVILTGLADRFAGERDQERARSLRNHLSLFTAPESAGRTLLGALWDEAE
jgi:hypothetical protein